MLLVLPFLRDLLGGGEGVGAGGGVMVLATGVCGGGVAGFTTGATVGAAVGAVTVLPAGGAGVAGGFLGGAFFLVAGTF